MIYLIGQIIFCLLLAFLLGGLLAWRLRDSAAKQREAILDEDLQAVQDQVGGLEIEVYQAKNRQEEFDAERVHANKRNMGLTNEVAAYSEEAKGYVGEISNLKAQLAKQDKRVKNFEIETDQFKQKTPLLHAELNKSKAKIVELEDGLAAKAADFDAKVVPMEEELARVYRDLAEVKISALTKDKKAKSLELLLASQTSKTESALQAKSLLEQDASDAGSRAQGLREQMRELQKQLSAGQGKIDELDKALKKHQAPNKS